MTALALLIVVGETRADAGVPFLQRERLDITFMFENLQAYPHFDFYLQEMHGDRAWHLLPASSSPSLHGPIGIPGDVFLLAVPRGSEMPTREFDKVFDKNVPAGMLRSPRLKGRNGVLSGRDNNTEITYRVHIDGETLTAEFVSATSPPLSRFAICGIVAACAIALPGIVMLIRRRWARAKTTYVGL